MSPGPDPNPTRARVMWRELDGAGGLVRGCQCEGWVTAEEMLFTVTAYSDQARCHYTRLCGVNLAGQVTRVLYEPEMLLSSPRISADKARLRVTAWRPDATEGDRVLVVETGELRPITGDEEAQTWEPALATTAQCVSGDLYVAGSYLTAQVGAPTLPEGVRLPPGGRRVTYFSLTAMPAPTCEFGGGE